MKYLIISLALEMGGKIATWYCRVRTESVSGFTVHKVHSIIMRCFIFFCLAISSIQVFAAADCKEQIEDLVIHNNGNIYFSTNLTCPHWCQLDMGGEKQTDRAYSMLLAARVKGEGLMFRWNSAITSCSQDNPRYTKPTYVFFHN